MSLKPIDPSQLRDEEQGGDPAFSQGATSMNKYGSPASAHAAHRSVSSGRARLIGIAAMVGVVVVVAVAVILAMRNISATTFEEPESSVISVTIPNAYGAGDIAQLLQQAGVIESTTEFLNTMQSAGDASSSLKAGAYEFERGMSYEQVINQLVAGPNAGVTLTIPEGFTLNQIAQRVQETLGISVDDFMAQAKASNYVTDYPFLSGAYNDSLEGYLFPLTYTFEEGVSADTVIRAMLTQFQTQTASLDLSTASKGGVTLNLSQVVVLASLIERETAVPSERALVSAVVYNRISAGMYLQIDAAINYAIGEDRLLTNDDLTVDSPYNTYTNLGLPPGPICSPSLAALQAAAAPDQDAAYLYYVASPALDGTHTFCNTEDEFWAAFNAYNEVMGF